MEHLTEATLWSFLLQAVAFVLYIPLSYIAYRWVRAPLKRGPGEAIVVTIGNSPNKGIGRNHGR